MALFIDPLKLNAAVRSMPQFRSVVRSLFPGPVHEVAVEAATVFLYVMVSRQVFGRRFTKELHGLIVRADRVGAPGEVEARARRLGRDLQQAERSIGRFATSKDQEFRDRIRGLITTLLSEAGYPANDPQLVADTFTRFEKAVRRIKAHLTGIKEQNHFVLKQG